MAKAKLKSRLKLSYGAIYIRRTKGGKFRWYLDYRDSTGKRIQKVAPLAVTQQEATWSLQEAVRKEFDAEYRIKRQREKTNFKELSVMYLENYAKPNKKSWKDDQYRIEAHMNPFFKDDEIGSISPLQIEKYRVERLKGGVTKSTINRELTILKKMFNLAIDWNLAEQNPVAKVKLFSEKDTKKERILKDEEEAQLLPSCPKYLRPIIIVALNTGMRRGEILRLRWKQVDLERRFITVENTKSGKNRTIPVNDVLYQELARIKAQSGKSELVFPNPKTERPFIELKKSFKKACRAVGIHDLRFHDLRHTFATRLIEAGVDIVTVMELMGHFSVRITQRYTHPGQNQKRRAVDLLAANIAKRTEKPENLLHSCDTEKPRAVEVPATNLNSVN